MNVIITGLAGSGKSTLAKYLGENIIVCDNHRYGKNWYKKTYEEYRESIMTSIDQPCIIEGAYYDANDNKNARIEVFHEILKKYSNTKVIIIRPVSLIDHIAGLIDRSIKRYIGEDSQGTCSETSTSRARLVIKNVKNYDECVRQLGQFYQYCINNNIEVEYYDRS